MKYLRHIFFIVLFAVIIMPALLRADTADELRNKIEDKEDEIAELNESIKALEKQLTQVGAERSTLEAAIRELNLTRQKLLSDIKVTEKKIEQTQYSITELGIAIDDKEVRIKRNNDILASAMRMVEEADNQSLIETVLAYESLSDLWVELDQMEVVQETIATQLVELRDLKSDLEEEEREERAEHENLSVFKSKLSGQQQVIDENKRAKDTLLATTRNKEAEYQQLLAQKQQARAAIESELQEYESQLAYVLDPSKLPKAGSGVLGWPVERPTLTQGFGLTSFARGGAYGYDKSGNPNPHRGVDFQASVGTPILAAAPGTVRGAVDMDKSPGCYSYGKWILVDHDNGLSTLYAHLSVMSVSAGEYVKKGGIIGYAGSTGYATGPHLHFTVFDRDAVKIDKFSWSVGCKNTSIAYAPYEAYLNPLSYLPNL